MSFQVHHDMNAPLSHYFMYTGHNSYLTGNQLSSECSDAPVIKALQRGVRVIELDLWPNSTKDDVNVLHGRYKLILKSISFDYVVIFLCLFVSLLCYKFFKYPYVANVMRDEFLIQQHMFLTYYRCSLSILLLYTIV